MNEPLFAIDSSVYIFRSHFALEPRWRSREGRPTETVYGFAVFLLKLLRNERPRYIAAAFDESLGTGFRHRLYPGYKANRALPDEDLAFQLTACRQVAQTLGIPTFACGEYEADDYLATLVGRAEAGQPVFVLSRDKDLAQLITDTTALWDYGYGEATSRALYLRDKGLAPELVADYLALVGDSSDNIPGVPGVGPKTAVAILGQLGPLEAWLDSPEKLAQVKVRGSRRLAEKIAPLRDQVVLAKQLTSLCRAVAGVPPLADLRWNGVDREAAGELFHRLGLDILQKRLPAAQAGAADGRAGP